MSKRNHASSLYLHSMCPQIILSPAEMGTADRSLAREQWNLGFVFYHNTFHGIGSWISFHTQTSPSRTACYVRFRFANFWGLTEQGFRYFDAARRALKEERSVVMRETENTILLLREPARRHMDAERAIGGNIHGSPAPFPPFLLTPIRTGHLGGLLWTDVCGQ